MNRTYKIVALSLLAFALFAVGGAFAYDAAKKDHLAPGVRIAGVDVGGNSVEEARPLIKKAVVAPLMRPVHVVFEGDTYEITPKDLEMNADLDGMLDDAVDASREGGLPTRLVRYATDGEVSEDIPPRISYSSDAFRDEVDEIVAKIDRDPVDASIEPSPSSIEPTQEQNGISVDDDKLRDEIEDQLQQGAGDREIEPVVRVTKPEVTTDELASAYPTYITVDRSSYKLTLWKNLKRDRTYGIAVGSLGYETPEGLYTINDKQVNPTWNVPDSEWTGSLAGQSIPPGPGNPLKARWMGIYDGAGIHGTDDIGSIGSAASHGCVRMRIKDVVELYDLVPTGTPIYIG